jgi:hypothetical protein
MTHTRFVHILLVGTVYSRHCCIFNVRKVAKEVKRAVAKKEPIPKDELIALKSTS